MSSAGPFARELWQLTVLLVALGAIVMVMVVVLAAMALRRRGPSGSPEDPGRTIAGRPNETEVLGLTPRSSRWLIIGGGVALPAVVIAVVFAWTLATMRRIPTSAPPNSLTVEVTGHQWWWEVRYPESGIVAKDEIHIPAGAPVELRLTSDDVIHSFWVPALNGKMDALPGRTNTLVVQADTPGRWSGQCAEFCGLHHARMRISVIAHEDFDAWLRAMAPSPEGEATNE